MTESTPSEKLARPDLRKQLIIVCIAFVAIVFVIRFFVDLAFGGEPVGLRRTISMIASALVILPAGACAYAFWGRERCLALVSEARRLFQTRRL